MEIKTRNKALVKGQTTFKFYNYSICLLDRVFLLAVFWSSCTKLFEHFTSMP